MREMNLAAALPGGSSGLATRFWSLMSRTSSGVIVGGGGDTGSEVLRGQLTATLEVVSADSIALRNLFDW